MCYTSGVRDDCRSSHVSKVACHKLRIQYTIYRGLDLEMHVVRGRHTPGVRAGCSLGVYLWFVGARHTGYKLVVSRFRLRLDYGGHGYLVSGYQPCMSCHSFSDGGSLVEGLVGNQILFNIGVPERPTKFCLISECRKTDHVLFNIGVPGRPTKY